MWMLKVYPCVGGRETVRKFKNLREIIEDYGNKEDVKEFEKLRTEKEKEEFVREFLSWIDAPYSPENDAKAVFELKRI